VHLVEGERTQVGGRAVREVEEARGRVGEHETGGEQRVQRTRHQSAQYESEKVRHAESPNPQIPESSSHLRPRLLEGDRRIALEGRRDDVLPVL
jgi:hypothetical protein